MMEDMDDEMHGARYVLQALVGAPERYPLTRTSKDIAHNEYKF